METSSRNGAEGLPDRAGAPWDGSTGERSEAEQADAELAESIDLVRRVQAGDEEALGLLFARYQDRLHRYARAKMGPKLREVMESMDIVQQANEVALRSIATFEIRGHAGIVYWLETILKHQMMDARKGLRAQKREKDREVPLAALAPKDGETWSFHPEADGPTPSQDASRAELARLYHACLEELAPEHRQVILLRDHEGEPWERVCERMGRPNVHATQELHRRARTRLASRIGRRSGRGAEGETAP